MPMLAPTTPPSAANTPHAEHIEIISDSSSGGFEGPEKLLEIWVAPSSEHIERRGLEIKGTRPNLHGAKNRHGLRQVDKSVWDKMLDEVQCKVLSVIEGEEVDAYLLSESSMFVWPHKLILKTCGTTTLLLGLPTLLRIASEICGLTSVYRCFYSRKTFMFPDRQKGPHKDWTQEMGFLDNLFDNSSAYTVGKMNGDHWLLYLTPPQDESAFTTPSLPSSNTSPVLAPATPSNASSFLHSFSTSILSALPKALLSPLATRLPAPDQTLEILMSRLDPVVCSSFYHPSSSPDASSADYTSPLFASDPADADAHALGSALSDRLGLSALLPSATIDSFLFSPCGFSSNAVQGDRYATIHVTPEVEYSYASFETNLSFGEEVDVIGTSNGHNNGEKKSGRSRRGSTVDSARAEGEPKSVQELVEKVLAVFQPAKFSITLFISMDDSHSTPTAIGDKNLAVLTSKLVEEKFKLVDRIVYEFEGYSLLYIVFEAKSLSKVAMAEEI